jgi:hypothetical protein
MNFLQVLKKNGFLSKNLIYNKTVLYFIFILALTNLFYFFQKNDIFSVLVFLIIGFLTTFFNKNMLIVLCMCLFFTNVLKYGRFAADHTSIEGLTDQTEEAEDAEESKEKKESKESKESEVPSKKKDMNPEPPENFDQVNSEKKIDDRYLKLIDHDEKEMNLLMNNQEKLLDNMNKYKPLLDTIKQITTNIKAFKTGE